MFCPRVKMSDELLKMPQWTTGSRLLALGEEIEFCFFLPAEMPGGELTIFPNYLECANPGERFAVGGDLGWLQALESERHHLRFTRGRASFTYRPARTGNYIARWRAGGEEFYRYFCVIEDDWTVLSFSPFHGLDPEPTFHGTGIPLSYNLPVEERIACPQPGGVVESYSREETFDVGSPLLGKFLAYHRHYGDAIIPRLQPSPNLSHEERVELYGGWLEKVRSLLPDANDARSVFIDDAMCDLPAYVEAFDELGVNDHCGLIEANAMPYLGMPEFPYFGSAADCRKVRQEPGGSVVGHQYDFCGGWHFLGPMGWHYKASEGNWGVATSRCLERGLQEAQNSAELSGHPAVLFPLYDGIGSGKHIDRSAAAWRFAERYQREMAFGFTKRFRLGFARTIDVADYYRKHFRVTPRTVFVSKTDHVSYDLLWQCDKQRTVALVTRGRLPRTTKISEIMAERRAVRQDKHPMQAYYKDPRSCEFVLFEDRKRSIRFERECPNPIWWFDYTGQAPGRALPLHGSSMTHTETPDVEVVRSDVESVSGDVTVRLKMGTDAEFPDYAIVLWGLPTRRPVHESDIWTNAREFVLASNTDGETHLILFFDLRPGVEIEVRLRSQPASGACI